jgi:fucose 4-O-acetylase-like acetyltransferase
MVFPRNQIIDIMRGTGILLVVLGHSIQKNIPNYLDNFLFRAIYTFHMPLFFLISGYLMYETLNGSRLQWIKDKAIYLLIPHLLFNIIYYPMSSTGLANYPDWPAMFSFPIWMKNSNLLNEGEWFLWTLFTCFCLMLLVDWVERKRSNRIFWVFVIALIFCLGALPSIAGDNWLRIFEFKFFGPMMIIGYLIARHKSTLKKYIVPACIIGVLSFSMLMTYDNASPRPQIDLIQYIFKGGLNYYFTKYFQALSGISMVLLIAIGINKIKFVSRIFAWLGVISLGIYLFSQCFSGVAFGNGSIRVLSGFTFSLLLSIIPTVICRRFKVFGILLGDISFFKNIRRKEVIKN